MDHDHGKAGGGGVSGGMTGMGGGFNDQMMGSSITAPALQYTVGIFPKLELYQKINSVSKFKKRGAKKLSLWYGPLELPSLEV
jgi:hypothetical protein